MFVLRRQYHPDPAVPKFFFLRIGQRVRVVRYDGCMAHVRVVENEGKIIGFENKNLYDGNSGGCDAVMARIQMDDGAIQQRVAEPSEWWKHDDGVMEYRH